MQRLVLQLIGPSILIGLIVGSVVGVTSASIFEREDPGVLNSPWTHGILAAILTIVIHLYISATPINIISRAIL